MPVTEFTDSMTHIHVKTVSRQITESPPPWRGACDLYRVLVDQRCFDKPKLIRVDFLSCSNIQGATDPAPSPTRFEDLKQFVFLRTELVFNVVVSTGRGCSD